MIQFGLPKNSNEVDDNIKSYYKYKGGLSYEDNLIFKNDRILVTVKLANDTMFWSGISQEVKEKVSNCQVFLEFGSQQHKQPIQIEKLTTIQQTWFY